ncbi:MAG: sulfite exporter TauE/SafE family protein [Myxococcota bacterium]|nr:sulfite exporter TauE/SafE family protein [Myxococcota bacterium]
MGALEVVALVVGGLGAGALSTVSGMGGGILLVVALSLALGPHAALATTAPALLAGNLHRLWLYRPALDRRIAGIFVIGALPGALIGGLLSAGLPERALSWILLGVTGFALGRAVGLFQWKPPAHAYLPVAFGAGVLAASSGAGILVSPMLVAGGLTGEALIATGAAAAAVMHVGRIGGYGLAGLFGGAALGVSLFLGAGILAGNGVGRRLRDRLGEARCMRVTYAVLVASVLGAIAGITR